MPRLIKAASGLRWITDAEWREADHPRDTDGKFASGGGSSAPTVGNHTEQNQKEAKPESAATVEMTPERARAAAQAGRDALKGGASYASAFKTATDILKCTHITMRIGGKEYKTVVSSRFGGELNRLIHPEFIKTRSYAPLSASEKMAIVNKAFVAMENIPGAAKYGMQYRCVPPASAHPGDKALTILSSFVYKGERQEMTLDLLVKKIAGESRLHNLNVEGSANFENKLWATKNGQKKKIKDSSEETVLELVEMHFE